MRCSKEGKKKRSSSIGIRQAKLGNDNTAVNTEESENPHLTVKSVIPPNTTKPKNVTFVASDVDIMSTPPTRNENEDFIDDLPSTQPVDDRVLKDVVVYVEVRSTNDNRSKAICKELVQLGAVVAKQFTNDVTHVVFKEGSKRTVTKATKRGTHLVSVLWVDSCKQNQEHVSERLYPATLPDQKGTPLLLTKLKKAKSMQPRDFEDDLASSAERCAKKKKKIDMDKLKSSESTPCNSPLLGVVLVGDTQPRGSPMTDVRTPVKLYIPDTPPSMRAKMLALQNKDEAQVENSVFSLTASKAEEKSSNDKVEFDEPLQRRLFSGFLADKDDSTNSNTEIFSNVKDSPAKCMVEEKKKRKTINRRKSVASECFKNNIDKVLEKDTKRSSLQDPTAGKEEEKRKLNRRKSIASVVIETTTKENPVKKTTRRKSMKSTTGQDKEEKTNIVECRKKALRKSKLFLESDFTDANKDAGNVNEPQKDDTDPQTSTSQTEVLAVDSMKVNEEENKKEQSAKLDFTSLISEAVIKGKSRRRSSVIAAQNIESSLRKKLTHISSAGQTSKATAVEEEKPSENSSHSSVKVDDKMKTKPKRKLLPSSDMEAHSFLIEPTECTQKTFKKILNLTPVQTSTQKKIIPAKQRKCQVNSSESLEIPQEQRCILSTEPDQTTDIQESVIPSIVNETISQSEAADTASKDSSRNESELGSSLSAVFSESNYPSFFGTAPPRQSIDEFNLRTKFNNKKSKRKRKIFSDSAVSSLNTDSDSISSNSDNDYRQKKKMKRQSSFSKNSPQRPSLVMTSLHSHEQDIVISVVKKLKNFVITDHVNEFTTHVVCGGPRRTLNILHAISRGCWVVKKEWVLESLEAGEWLPEEKYEVTEWFPSVMETRLRKQVSQENSPQLLFSSMGTFYITPKANPPRQHLIELVQRCAGKVTSSTSKADICVGSDFLPDKTSVNPLWILDCVTQNVLLPVENYLLGRPKTDSSPEY